MENSVLLIIHADDSRRVAEKVFVQHALVMVERGHGRSVRQNLLAPECVAYLVTIVDKKQVGVPHQAAHFDDLSVDLVQLKHDFVELLDFVLTYDNKKLSQKSNSECKKTSIEYLPVRNSIKCHKGDVNALKNFLPLVHSKLFAFMALH